MKKWTTNSFSKASAIIHNNKYDYSCVNYINYDAKVEIICRIHSSFYQRPDSHLHGHGCNQCAIEQRNMKHLEYEQSKRKNRSDKFLKTVKAINNTLDYSKVEYVNAITPVIVICPTHGPFENTPNVLLGGVGCNQCSRTRQANLCKKNTQDFINEVSTIHNNEYTYIDTVYTNSHAKILITCPIHGNFSCTPSSHIQGTGCKKCSNENHPGGYSLKWFNTDINRKILPGFLYLLQFSTPEEQFLKIGITQTSLEKRYSTFQLNKSKLKYTILCHNPLPIYDAFRIEQQLKIELKKWKYWPRCQFYGKTECFDIQHVRDMPSMIDKYIKQFYEDHK